MILSAWNTKRPWTPEEDNQLREMAGAGKSIIMIALKFKRTVLAFEDELVFSK
jgi:hypothetical protein